MDFRPSVDVRPTFETRSTESRPPSEARSSDFRMTELFPSSVSSEYRSPELSEVTELFASNFSQDPSISSSDNQDSMTSANAE
jgi:hypothetical protein